MSTALYDLLFEGVAQGQSVEQAKIAFAQLFGVDIEKAERIFASKNSILKTKVDEATAEKYITRLARIGVVVGKRAIIVAPAGLALEPIENNVASEHKTDQHHEPANTSIKNEPVASGAISSHYVEPVYAEHAAMHQTVEPVYGQEQRRIPFEFTGKGFEYFKIWIVNILLTIVTVGIYGAWAKVRNKQYFYGNTSLDNISFEYTAEPLKILKGRLIAVAFFAVYFFSRVSSSSILSLIMALLLIAFMPWIIVNSLKFNARHTSYRNINFRFTGKIFDAFKAFLLWPLAGALSLFILMPFAWKKQVEYITNNHQYGNEPFKFEISVKKYYKMLGVLLGATILFCFVMFALLGASLVGVMSKDPAAMSSAAAKMVPAMLIYFAFYVALGAYFITTMANLHFNNTQLQQHRFQSNWGLGSYAVLLLTNTLGIIFTLGLFIPFAKVRAAAYRMSHTAIVVSGNLESFIAAEREQSNSLAEGVHDIFDIDISL